MENSTNDNHLLLVLFKNPLKPKKLLGSSLKSQFFSVLFLTKTWTLLSMLCLSTSLREAKKSSKKEKKVFNFMSLVQENMNVSSKSMESRPTLKLIRKDNILVNLPSCVLCLELLQLIALKAEFYMVLIGLLSNTSWKNLLKKEEKNSEPFYQKSKSWPELETTKKNSCAIS